MCVNVSGYEWVYIEYGGGIEGVVAKLNGEHPHDQFCPEEDGCTVLSESAEFNEMSTR